MSAGPARDSLLTTEDAMIEAEGSDATRLTFRAAAACGNPGQATAALSVTPPAAGRSFL